MAEAAAVLRDRHLLEEPDDYRNIVTALANRRAWAEALSLWDEMVLTDTESTPAPKPHETVFFAGLLGALGEFWGRFFGCE